MAVVMRQSRYIASGISELPFRVINTSMQFPIPASRPAGKGDLK